MDTMLKLNHLGIAVEHLEEAVKLYEALGLKCSQVEMISAQKVRTATLPLGEITIELLEPTESNSPVGKFLANKGPGVHHIAIQVDDLQGHLQTLKRLGLHLIDETPRNGLGGSSIAFIHPQSTFNTLIELVQPRS